MKKSRNTNIETLNNFKIQNHNVLKTLQTSGLHEF